MRLGFLFSLLLFIAASLAAQDSSNPFELVPRLDPEKQEVEAAVELVEEAAPVNPFDIGTPTTSTAPAASESVNTNNNPFELNADEDAVSEKPVDTRPEEQPSAELGAEEEVVSATGTLLILALVVLVFATISLLFFRSIYARCYRALFNDNLLSQLYREREAGALGSFLIMYGVFFVAAGFFIALAGQYFDLFPSGQLWRTTWYSSVGLFSLLLLKHLILAILGYVFPIGKETRRYSFAIMVFWIIGGLILSLGALLLAYAPEGAEKVLIWGTIGLLVLLYLLRSLRGFFIANRFIFSYQFHFLSYICAVEIGPALCFIKVLTDFQ